MGVLRLMGRSSILENNIVATGASAASSIAAGTIFTIPALVIMGHWSRFDYWWVLAIAGLGGLLGVLFSVPLRRTLILDQKLQFPEGVATAEVLKVGQDPGRGLKALSIAAATGALFKLALSGLRLSPESFAVARYFGDRTIGFFGINLSPALLGVGYIVGFNIGCLMLVRRRAVLVGVHPVLQQLHDRPEPGARPAACRAPGGGRRRPDLDPPDPLHRRRRDADRRALVAVVAAQVAAVRNPHRHEHEGRLGRGRAPHRAGPADEGDPVRHRAIRAAAVRAVLRASSDSFGIALAMAVIMVVAGFVFSSVSGYMAGLVGSSNNPVSGITISTILFASLVLLAVMGKGSTVGPVAAIMIGAVICSAAAVAGDNLQDLKAGQLVGATPWRQQVMLGIGAIASAAIMAPVLNLLLEAYGIGTPAREGVNALAAPQATLMASVASGIFGSGLPWNMVAIGAAVGAIVIALDEHLKRSGKSWRAPVLAVAVGIYLPLELSTPIFAGGLIAELATRWHRRRSPGARSRDTQADRSPVLRRPHRRRGHRRRADRDPDRPDRGCGRARGRRESMRPGQWAGLAALAVVGWWMLRVATRQAPKHQ